MEIKKKLVEMKDKTKAWCAEHKEALITAGIGCLGIVITGGVRYCEGYGQGRADKSSELLGDASSNPHFTRYFNSETGVVDGIVSDKMNTAFLKSPDIKLYDDGSWDYLDEIEES